MIRSPRFLLGLVGIAGTIAAIVYCGRLVFYFFDVGGSWQADTEIGLGPTIVGLGGIGLLFCLVLVFKAVRLFQTPRSPGSDGSGPRPPATPFSDDGDGFDADAVISRYMARRPAGGEPEARSAAADRRPSTAPSGFGRRTSAS